MRVVRGSDGSVAFDKGGKLPGRGAYVCAAATCISASQKAKKLDRSLKAQVGPEVYIALLAQSEAGV